MKILIKNTFLAYKNTFLNLIKEGTLFAHPTNTTFAIDKGTIEGKPSKLIS